MIQSHIKSSNRMVTLRKVMERRLLKSQLERPEDNIIDLTGDDSETEKLQNNLVTVASSINEKSVVGKELQSVYMKDMYANDSLPEYSHVVDMNCNVSSDKRSATHNTDRGDGSAAMAVKRTADDAAHGDETLRRAETQPYYSDELPALIENDTPIKKKMRIAFVSKQGDALSSSSSKSVENFQPLGSQGDKTALQCASGETALNAHTAAHAFVDSDDDSDSISSGTETVESTDSNSEDDSSEAIQMRSSQHDIDPVFEAPTKKPPTVWKSSEWKGGANPHFTCEVCDKTFKMNEKTLFTEHLFNHRMQEQKELSLICSDCHIPFHSDEVLQHHFLHSGHGVGIAKVVNEDGEEEVRKIQCCYCPSQFSHNHYYKVHMESGDHGVVTEFM